MNNQAMVFWGYAFKKKSWPCYIFSNYYKPTKKEKKSPPFFKWAKDLNRHLIIENIGIAYITRKGAQNH